MKTQIAITSDHAGYEMKEALKTYLSETGRNYVDLGTNSSESVDYPVFGHKLGLAIEKGEYKIGITICGSGNGINMVSNKHSGVRGAICWNKEISEMARKHNDANVCSLPARYIDLDLAIEIIETFLSTSFEGGRHERRIKNIDIKE